MFTINYTINAFIFESKICHFLLWSWSLLIVSSSDDICFDFCLIFASNNFKKTFLSPWFAPRIADKPIWNTFFFTPTDNRYKMSTEIGWVMCLNLRLNLKFGFETSFNELSKILFYSTYIVDTSLIFFKVWVYFHACTHWPVAIDFLHNLVHSFKILHTWSVMFAGRIVTGGGALLRALRRFDSILYHRWRSRWKNVGLASLTLVFCSGNNASCLVVLPCTEWYSTLTPIIRFWAITSSTAWE